MSDSISLAQSYGDESAIPSSISREPSYPSFHYSGTEDLDLPDEGTMTIKYRVRSETHATDKSGQKHYECSIEVQSIEKVKGEAETYKKKKDAGDYLDELMKAKQDEEGGEEEGGE